MIDYLKAANRLRRLLSSLKVHDPELSRLAEMLERFGGTLPKSPVSEVLREAGDFFRDLQIPLMEEFVKGLDFRLDPNEEQERLRKRAEDARIEHNDRQAVLKKRIEKMRQEHNESLIVLKATQGERDRLKEQVETLRAENMNLESAKSYGGHQLEAANKEIAALRGMPDADTDLLDVLRRYCIGVVDPSSTPMEERLALFRQLLKRVS